MTDRKKQTAVQYLLHAVSRIIELNPNERRRINEVVEKAKAMEKEALIDAHIAGMEFIPVDPNRYREDAERYYNGTFSIERD
jgi:hypothetical protein